MTVKELIDILQTKDPNALIIRDSHQGGNGYFCVSDVRSVSVVNSPKPDWSGTHEEFDPDKMNENEEILAVYLT